MHLESLRKVQQQASALEAQELRKLVGMQDLLQREQQQGQQLLQHQQLYRQQVPGAGQQVSAALLQQYQHFLLKLRQAIEQQDARIQHFSSQCEKQREQWKQSHSRVQSLDFLIEREEKRLQALELKKEQRQLDEFNHRLKVRP